MMGPLRRGSNRGVPNHAITQIFFLFTHSRKNWVENGSFHEITQEKFSFHEFTLKCYAFHASRMEVISRIHAGEKAHHAITQTYGGPPPGGSL